MFIQGFYSNIHAIDNSISQFITVFRCICNVVTSKLISEVLHVPKADHLDYPNHHHLFFISRVKLASLLYEKAML